jgi:hypothetical protein
MICPGITQQFGGLFHRHDRARRGSRASEDHQGNRASE